MTDGEAIYHHGRSSLATCSGMIVSGLLGVAISPAFFAVTFFFSLMTGWHLGQVAYRSFRA